MDFDLFMTLIVLAVFSIGAALVCVYPVFLVFPGSRVPAVWVGMVWAAGTAMLLAGLLFRWDRAAVASLGIIGAAAGLGYSLTARRILKNRSSPIERPISQMRQARRSPR